jgi:hypothetical protein
MLGYNLETRDGVDSRSKARCQAIELGAGGDEWKWGSLIRAGGRQQKATNQKAGGKPFVVLARNRTHGSWESTRSATIVADRWFIDATQKRHPEGC